MAGVGPGLQIEGDLGRHGAPGGQRGQSAPEADVERGRVDAPGDVAQLGDGLLGAVVGLVDELADPIEVDLVVGQLLLGHAEPHGQRDQLGLGAVVQVALDAAQRGGRGVDGHGAGLLEACGRGWPRDRD